MGLRTPLSNLMGSAEPMLTMPLLCKGGCLTVRKTLAVPLFTPQCCIRVVVSMGPGTLVGGTGTRGYGCHM